MEKHRLLIDQKKYLSFSNYKKYINQQKNTRNERKLILDINSPPSFNFIFKKKIQKNITQNYINNVPKIVRLSNSNKIFNKKIKEKIYTLYKINSNLNLQNNISTNIENKSINKLFKFKNMKNKDVKFEENKEALEENNFKKYIDKKRDNYFESAKNMFNKTNYFFKYKLNSSTYNKPESFYNENNKKELNDDAIKIFKPQKLCVSTRKINKESFRNEIYKIINQDNGRQKIKFKIIGRLKTEYNYN